jgi:hypothetical protein
MDPEPDPHSFGKPYQHPNHIKEESRIRMHVKVASRIRIRINPKPDPHPQQQQRDADRHIPPQRLTQKP